MKTTNLIALLLLVFCPLVVVGQTPPTCTVAFPYTEGFNTASITNCWSQAQVAGNSSTNATITAIQSSASGPTLQSYEVDGGYCLRFRSQSAASGVKSRMMSSAFNTVGKMNVTVKFKLWHTNESAFASSNDRVQVQFSTNGTTWESTGSEMVVYNAASNGWSEKTIVLPSAAQGATTLYVALLFTSSNVANVYLDTVRVTAEDYVACSGTPTPGNTLSTASSACIGTDFTLSLQNTTTAAGQSYQWQSSANGSTGWANISGATSSTLTRSQTASTYYRCNVTCSGNTGTSNALQVVTDQPYAALPYTENFESWTSKCNGTTNAPSQYWTSTPSTGNNSWRRNDQGSSAAWSTDTYGIYSPVSQSGSYSARFHSTYASTGTLGILDLFVDCSTGSSSKTLTFYHINTSGSDKLEVFVSTDGGQNFTEIGTDLVQSASWAYQSRDFTSTSAQTVIRLRATSDYGGTDMGIDNLTVADTPTCFAPTNLTATNVLANSATVSWGAASPVPGNGYEYYLSTSSAAPVTGTVATGSTTGTSVALTNLTADTTYYIWVRSVCSASDKSAWTLSALNFFTGYCSASSSSSSYYISNFSTTSGTQNIAYTTGSQPTGGYSYPQTGNIISANAGSAFNYSTTYSTASNRLIIWIDWNNDLVLSDSEKYSGTNSSSQIKTGSITIPTGTAPGNYRMRVRTQNGSTATFSACGSSTSTSTTLDFTLTVLPCYTWTGAVSSNWFAAGNWCGGVVPGATADVTITTGTNPIIAGNVQVKSITLAAGKTITINSGATLTVLNSLTNNGTIEVQNNAALVQPEGSAYSGSGTATVTRLGNPLFRLDYTMWGSPVTGSQTLLQFSPYTATSPNRFYIYGYNETQELYLNVPSPQTTTFAKGKSYLIRMPNNLPEIEGYNIGNTQLAFTGTFNGTPNNGDIDVKIIDADAGTNFNGHYIAVSNPYPSPISVKAFFDANEDVLDAATTMYFWRKKNDATTSSYAKLNLNGYVKNTGSTLGGDIDGGGASYYPTGTENILNWVLSPGQGFLVKLKTNLTATQYVKFRNSMRRSVTLITDANNNPNQPFFKTQNNNEEPAESRWWMNLTGTGDAFSQTLVGYLPQATLGVDFALDGRSYNDGNTRLYSSQQGEGFGIQARPSFIDTDVVTMGYTVSAAGQYTLSLDRVEGVFAQGQAIYIKDNLLGTVTNISEAGTYSFTTATGTFETRFEVIYQPQGQLGTTNPELENLVMVYQNNGAINITSGNVEMQGVTLYDIRGRKLYEQNGINATQTAITALNAAHQVIIVEINTVNGTVSKKIVY